MGFNIEKYTSKGMQFIHEVAKLSGNEKDTDKAMRLIRAVLHALRNRISMEESLQLISQLPLFIKGIYVDGWTLKKPDHQIKTIEGFVDEVIQEDGASGFHDFTTTENAVKQIAAVFQVLRNHVSPGEINDIISGLPKELKQLWNDPLIIETE